MGAPLSPMVAGLFMEDFEQTALMTTLTDSQSSGSNMWKTPSLSGHMEEHSWIPSRSTSLARARRYSSQWSWKNQLPSLDVLIQRSEDSLTILMYLKKTHTDSYLHFQSHHHPQGQGWCDLLPQKKGQTSLYRGPIERTGTPVQCLPRQWVPMQDH